MCEWLLPLLEEYIAGENPLGSLQGKVAVVTGGARGLGAEICRVLAQSGSTVIVADVREQLAAELVQEIKAEGGKCEAVTLDVGEEEAVSSALGEIGSDYGRLDIVVNNAAVDVTCSIEELSFADWDRIIRTNLRGPFALAKIAFPMMRQQGGGAIVNIASTASKRVWANAAAYHASKWGLLSLSHALHVEGRACNIKVSAVISGGMRTPFLLDRFADIDPGVLQNPRNVAETVKFILMQPPETVIPEVMVLPMRETSWP
ncbi:MAG: SDR family oxidoreductase [Deltaproteobacteria bacterium]|nr:SDR family oxidoreductase [Deltaproteobacteria bacterium]